MIASVFRFFLLFLIPFTGIVAQGSTLRSPDEFLPHKLGSRFTPHHLLVDYFRYVDGLSDKMQIIEYGQTYELRPLIAAVISSPANMKRIEEIRLNNLYRTGMLDGTSKAEDIVFVYLSYTVHGNEAAGAESSMAVLYDLIKGGAPYDAWLENTVVIIDPVLNPDGYNRYSQWSNSVSASPNNPSPIAREHSEPWPGGRSNHYYFDLNRDWAWQSQKESRDRVAFYLKWMPHVHADIHEMGAEAPYYFAPAAPPYHPHVTPWQASFQIDIGKNHAAHFDREGWRYYTRERFDLFYPSYGDTYPTFAGAIGMTYEQGGGGYANRSVILHSGDTLTLYDRIAHHRVASLSTIEVSARNAGRLVTEFEHYYKHSISDPPGDINSYVIKASNPPGKIIDLLLLLERQGIIYGTAKVHQQGLKGWRYAAAAEASFEVTEGDIIIPAAQPRAVLLQVLFEPQTKLEDSLTYDITAWCVPLAFGLEMFATESKLQYISYHGEHGAGIDVSRKPVAYAMQWGSVASSKALTTLLEDDMIARYATIPFTLDNVYYPAGTVLWMRGDNRKHLQFDEKIAHIAQSYPVRLTPLRTGFVDSGKDLGSGDYRLVRHPKVLVLAGEGVRSLQVGEVWHFFEEELNFPLHLVNVNDVDFDDLEQFNVIILTDGSYSLTEDKLKKTSDWISNGGRLIVMGSALNKFAGKSGFDLSWSQPDTTTEVETEEIIHIPETYAQGERSALSEEIPGAIFQSTMDKSHPLSFGLGETYWTLKATTANYAWMKNGGNAIYLDDTPLYFGFAGYKALERTRKTLVAGQQVMGAGTVVYLVDNPLFRSFWYSGKILFSNALFF